MADFAGKVVLVTGGGSGIGAAIALELGRRRAEVIVNDLDEATGSETVRRIEAAGGTARFIRADVSREAEVEAMLSTIVADHGRLDGAVNNAGVEHEHLPLHQITEAMWDRTNQVNLKGVWLCMKHEITQMLRQGSGAIVNLSSVAGLVGAGTFAPYAATKHGVLGLTKSATIEYAKRGIRCNAVCPGIIRTDMLQRSLDSKPKIAQWMEKSNPLERLGEPEEIAQAVIWLLSEESSFIHGHALTADGGMVIR